MLKQVFKVLLLVPCIAAAEPDDSASVESRVQQLLGQASGSLVQVINEEIKRNPQEVVAIVSASMRNGAKTSDIAGQCEIDTPSGLIPDIVGTATAEGANGADLLEICLPAVPEEEAVNVLVAILQNAQPTEVESLIQLALATLQFNGVNDGSTVVVNSLLQGNFLGLGPANCDADCLRPIAQSYVADLSPFDVDGQIIEELSNNDRFRRSLGEPPLSES